MTQSQNNLNPSPSPFSSMGENKRSPNAPLDPVIAAEFRRRKTWSVGALACLAVLWGVFFIFREHLNPGLIILLGGLSLAALAVDAWAWRCPVCKKRLGRSGAIRRCRHCGTRLQA